MQTEEAEAQEAGHPRTEGLETDWCGVVTKNQNDMINEENAIKTQTDFPVYDEETTTSVPVEAWYN